MAALSDYLENEILDHILDNGRSQAFNAPASLYIGLFTSSGGLESNTSGSWTEVSGGAYARQELDGSSNYFTVASGGSSSNHADITFPVATGDWGTVSHVAVLDSLSGGNVLFWGALTSSKTIETGDQFKISSDNLVLSMD